MKQLLTIIGTLAFMLISTFSFAQAPQKFNYQGIARDVKGNPLAKQKMSLKISVLPTQDATVSEYEETQMVTTNEFGLYTLQIGNGTPITGEMKTVKWETGNKYIKIAIDQKGGADYVDAGTTQLLSVPYAIYADKAGLARETVEGTDKTRAGTVSTSATGTGTVNFLTKFTAANTIYNSQVFDNGTNVGIGTTTPAAKLQLTGTTTAPTELRIQHTNTGAGGASRLSFKNDNLAGFVVGSDFAIMNKQASGNTGNAAAGYPNSRLFGFNNSMGNLLFSSNGSVGFGSYNISASPQVTVRMHIDSATGNIGIGTVTPAAKLTVKNTTAGELMRLDGGTQTYNSIYENGVYRGYFGSYSGNDKDVDFGSGQSTNGKTHLTTNATPKLTVDSAGNVGIGTTSPSARLHIPDGEARIGSSLGGSVLNLGNTTNIATPSIGFLAGGTDEFGIAENGSGQLIFTPNYSTAGSGSSMLTLDDDSQNIGMGTDAPTDKLHVVGGITTGDNSTQQGRITLLPTNGSAFFHIKNNNDGSLRISNGASAGVYDMVSMTATAEMTIGVKDSFSANRNLRINTAAGTGSGLKINVGQFNNSLGLSATGSFLRTLSSTDNFVSNNVTETWISPGTFFAPGTDNTLSCGSLSYRWNAVYAVNGTIQTSDMRLKTNVADLNYGLNTIMNIKPISYNWKSDAEGKRKIGFSAQELEKVIPEIVYHQEMSQKEKDAMRKEGIALPAITDPYGVNYADMAPILVKAIQEQQKMIDDLKKEIEILKSK